MSGLLNFCQANLRRLTFFGFNYLKRKGRHKKLHACTNKYIQEKTKRNLSKSVHPFEIYVGTCITIDLLIYKNLLQFLK